MGPADARQSAGTNYQHPQAAYLPHLGSINEQAQLPYAARDYYPDVRNPTVLPLRFCPCGLAEYPPPTHLPLYQGSVAECAI